MEFLSYFSYGGDGWGDDLLAGLAVTAELALVTLPFGLAIGLFAAVAALSANPILRGAARTFTTTFRGVPELLTLFVVYNGAALLLNSVAKWLNPDADFVELSPFVAGVISLGLVFGAYSGEVFRGAFQALDKGQLDAGLAIGMSRWRVFFRIQLPQVCRFALPGLGNLWVSLIKDTALVSIIALNDLMRMTNVAVQFTKKPFVFYLAACLAYWVLCLLSEQVLAWLERRANRGIRKV